MAFIQPQFRKRISFCLIHSKQVMSTGNCKSDLEEKLKCGAKISSLSTNVQQQQQKNRQGV